MDATSASHDRYDILEQRVDEMDAALSTQFRDLRGAMGAMQTDINGVKGRLTVVEQRLDKVEQRLDKVERRLGRVEERLTTLERRVSDLDTRMQNGFDALNERLDRLQETLEAFVAAQKQIARDQSAARGTRAHPEPRRRRRS
jgi:chromosome segregation ATPase